MLRRALRWLRWAAPPAAFLAWAYRAYRAAADAAIPAFGPPEPLVAAWRAEMLEQLGLGALLAAFWIACWAWPGGASARVRRTKVQGAFPRPGISPARQGSALRHPGGRARERGRGLN